MRFVILFSMIIPISWRISLDFAKLVYKRQMTSDRRLPGLQVRSSTLPEELGVISYLLTDKTGTLTRNEMHLRKLHVGFACLSPANLAEMQALYLPISPLYLPVSPYISPSNLAEMQAAI